MRLLSLLFISIFGALIFSQAYAAEVCIQKIQYAQNNATNECQAFPTPCDVPSDWTPVDECSLPTRQIVTPKFQVEKFDSCEAMESAVIDILKRYQSRYWNPYMLYARDGMATFGMVAPTSMAEKSVASPAPSAGANTPVSTTNTQVL